MSSIGEHDRAEVAILAFVAGVLSIGLVGSFVGSHTGVSWVEVARFGNLGEWLSGIGSAGAILLLVVHRRRAEEIATAEKSSDADAERADELSAIVGECYSLRALTMARASGSGWADLAAAEAAARGTIARLIDGGTCGLPT